MTVFTIDARDEVGSTSDEAKALAAAGAADGTVVWAQTQNAGRGRHGRNWRSPPGNLYLSIVLRPTIPAARTAEFGFVAALAVAETVGALSPLAPPARLKWPNDVLIDGAKIAGILLEADLAGSAIASLVLGIGINIVSAPADTPYPATFLAAHGPAPDVRLARDTLLERLGAWRIRWQSDGFGAVRAAWTERAARLGEPATVRLGAGAVEGIFCGIAEDGAMLLDTGGAIRRIASGELVSGG